MEKHLMKNINFHKIQAWATCLQKTGTKTGFQLKIEKGYWTEDFRVEFETGPQNWAYRENRTCHM
jgi:hypothetical protein